MELMFKFKLRLVVVSSVVVLVILYMSICFFDQQPVTSHNKNNQSPLDIHQITSDDIVITYGGYVQYLLCQSDSQTNKSQLQVNTTKQNSSSNVLHVPSLMDGRGDSKELLATGGELAGSGGKGGGGGAGSEYVPYVIGVSPTYYRQTQRLDLTRLCQTLMNVPRFLWIVVEDSTSTSEQVKEILANCKVKSVLMNAVTSAENKKANLRGVDQRNHALQWLRQHCQTCEGRGTCQGVVYFMDDDNAYSVRLFERIRWTRNVSVFPIGLVAGLKFEGPVCKDGKVERWQVKYAPSRHVPVDMAAFAVNVKTLLAHPEVRMGLKPNKADYSYKGHIEADFLKSIGASKDTVECRGAEDEVLVWHVKSTYNRLVYEKKYPSDPKFKV